MTTVSRRSQIVAEVERALKHACADALRSVIAQHPSMTMADLRAIYDEHPSLGELPLHLLFGDERAEPRQARPRGKRRARKPSQISSLRQPALGQLLRELREEAGLTHAALTEEVGVTGSAIARLEGGQDVRLSSYFPIVEYFIEHERVGNLGSVFGVATCSPGHGPSSRFP